MSEPDDAAVEAVAQSAPKALVLRADLSVAGIYLHDPPMKADLGMADEIGPERAPHTYWRLVDDGLLAIFRDAERLRNLAARLEGHLNRGQTFTGAEIAAMLRGDGA